MNEWTKPTCDGTGLPLRKITRAPGVEGKAGRGLCQKCGKEVMITKYGARKHVALRTKPRRKRPGRKANKRTIALKRLKGKQ